MKSFVCLVALILVCCLSVSAAEPQAVQYRADDPRPRLYLPFTMTTPDGLVLEAGEYLVTIHQSQFKYVGRPPGSLGLWPGPRVFLQRLQDPIAELAYVTLKTASQVWVVYDIPGWQERQRQIRATFSGVAPYIRNRQLVGLVYRGDILYITEARPGRRFR